ncbi:hypothetical protein ACLOJK_007711 [Asimina triloba]
MYRDRYTIGAPKFGAPSSPRVAHGTHRRRAANRQIQADQNDGNIVLSSSPSHSIVIGHHQTVHAVDSKGRNHPHRRSPSAAPATTLIGIPTDQDSDPIQIKTQIIRPASSTAEHAQSDLAPYSEAWPTRATTHHVSCQISASSGSSSKGTQQQHTSDHGQIQCPVVLSTSGRQHRAQIWQRSAPAKANPCRSVDGQHGPPDQQPSDLHGTTCRDSHSGSVQRPMEDPQPWAALGDDSNLAASASPRSQSSGRSRWAPFRAKLHTTGTRNLILKEHDETR